MIITDETSEENITMRSYRRSGSEVVVHVNGDWSGTALVAVTGSSSMTELPVVDLLRGNVAIAKYGPIDASSMVEAVSIAVEAFTRQACSSAIGNAITVSEITGSGHRG